MLYTHRILIYIYIPFILHRDTFVTHNNDACCLTLLYFVFIDSVSVYTEYYLKSAKILSNKHQGQPTCKIVQGKFSKTFPNDDNIKRQSMKQLLY